MFRQLIGLVLLSLAAFGISPAQADEAYLYQGAPKVEVFKIQQYSGTPVTEEAFDLLSSVDNLQPTISSASSRTYFTIRTQVLTNGPIDNIDVVAVCLYSQGNVAVSDIDLSTNCGYNTDAATRAEQITPPSGYNAAHVISMAWTTNSAFRLDDDTSNQHEVSGDLSREGATESVSRTIAGQTVSLTAKRLDFTFALSHAAVNTDDWAVRVVAFSTASPLNTEGVDTEAFEHYYHGTCSNTYGDGQQISADGTRNSSCTGDPFDYGMNFFGGFMQSTVRDSYSYGAIAENGSSGPPTFSLDTARYFANDTVSMTISASDFTFSDDTIPLSQDGGSVTGQKALRMVCNGQTDVSGSPTTNSVDVGTTIKDFFTLMDASSDSGEASVAAPQHDCELFYGTGATYGDETYSNSVTLGLYDAGVSGPSATGLFQSVTTDSSDSDTFTVSSTDTAIRGQ